MSDDNDECIELMLEYTSKFKKLTLHLMDNPILGEEEKTEVMRQVGELIYMSAAKLVAESDLAGCRLVVMPDEHLPLVAKALKTVGVNSLQSIIDGFESKEKGN
jgi:hypothetical protein